MMRLWNLEMDTALVSIINELCRGLRIASARLHPHELLLTDAHLASQGCASLHSKLPSFDLWHVA